MSPRILFSIIIILAISAFGPAAILCAEPTAQEKYLMSLQKANSDVEEPELDLEAESASQPEAESDIGMEFVNGSEIETEPQAVSASKAKIEIVSASKPALQEETSKPIQKVDAPKADSKGWGLKKLLGGSHRIDSEELEDNYQKALRSYNRQQMEKAQKAFEKIDRQYPDYKDTRRYLTVIYEEAERKQKILSDEDYRREVLKGEVKKEEWRKDVETQVVEDSLMRERKAEQAYKDARVLYDQKQFEKAREKFEFVERTIPSYRQTNAFLKSIEQKTSEVVMERFKQESVQPVKESSVKITELPPIQLQSVETIARADDAMGVSNVSAPVEEVVSEEEIPQRMEESNIPLDEVRQEEKDSKAEPLYEQALSLFNSEKYDEAEKTFWQVQAVNPDYKAVLTYLKKIEEARKEDELRALDDQARQFSNQLRAERLAEKIRGDKEDHISKQMAKAQRKELENLYHQAKDDYDRKDYLLAKQKFEQISSRQPGYGAVDRYLQKINAIVPPEQKRLNVPAFNDLAGVDLGIQGAVKSRREQLVQITQEKYNQALVFYKNKNYPEAKYKFIEVEAMAPDYKETRSYLTRLEAEVSQVPSELTGLLAAAQPIKTSVALTKVVQAETKSNFSSEMAESEEGAVIGRKKLSVFNRLFGSKKTKDTEASDFSEVDDPQIEQMYQDAIAAYGRGNYLSAEDQFGNLQDAKKGYKDSENYLRLSRKMVQQKEKERLNKVQQLAEDNKTVIESDNQEKPQTAAVRISQNVGKISEEKSSRHGWFGKKKKEGATDVKVMVEESAENVNKVEEISAESAQVESEASQVDQEKVEQIYQEAIVLYDQGNYLGAQDRFQSITEVLPNYKNAVEYLKKSRNMVAKKEKERLYGAKQLAKNSQGDKEESAETEAEEKSFLNRMKFWNKSSEEKEAAVAPMSEDSSRDQKAMAKLKEDISTRESEDADRIAKLERRHKREVAEKSGLLVDDKSSVKKSGSLVAKIFDRKERDATLDQRRKDLEKMVIERRKSLQNERSKIQKEFDKSLDDLYSKAVKMNAAGLHQQAYKIFVEIDRLQPGYKDTQKYLARITQVPSSRFVPPVISYSTHSNVVSRDDIISSTLDQFEKGR